MHLSCIDLVYIHNAFESWYEDISREEFLHMLSKVFEVYEEYRSRNKIKHYGMATLFVISIVNHLISQFS